MTFLSSGKVNYNARIERASSLASRYSFAREVLEFYGKIAAFQKQFYEQLPRKWGKQPIVPPGGVLRGELNLPPLIEPFEKFLALLQTEAPGPLSAQARLLHNQSKDAWADMLFSSWKTGLLESLPQDSELPAHVAEPLNEFLGRAFLQPYAEFIVSSMLPPNLTMTVCRCPRCNSLPLLGVLRPEGDGGKRYLQCAFCSQEWEFRRILCPTCGEETESKLPVYIAEQLPHIRVEACDT